MRSKVENQGRWNWTLLWKDTQRSVNGGHYGHSFWRDELTGKVSVKDMSGSLPHTTDDGVLWVDDSRPVTFSLGRDGEVGAYASLPVLDGEGDPSLVPMRWVDAIEACRRLDLRAKVAPEIGELLRLVADLACLSMKGGE